MPRIVVVDDDADVVRLVCRRLALAGWETRSAGTGLEALEQLSEEVDVLLCDNHLPGLNGVQVLTEARARFPRLATVLMTAVPGRQVLAPGIDAYLAKPFRALADLPDIIDQARSRREQALLRERLQQQLAGLRNQPKTA